MTSGGVQHAMPIATDDRAPSAARVMTAGGLAAIAGGLLAIVGNALVLSAAPSAPSGTVSYALSPQDYRLGQLFFAFTQALMTAGIVVLVRSRIAGHGRQAQLGGSLAAAGFAVTIPGELVLALVADAASNSDGAGMATTLFGMGLLTADVGLILFGIAAVRAGVWARRWAVLPIALGAFQLLIVTPVVLTAGFGTVAAFAAITASDLLVALLGLRMVVRGRLAA